MHKFWLKRTLARLQRQIGRKIHDHAYHLKMSSLTNCELNLLIYKRDETLEELDLSDYERKKFGLCPKGD